MAAAACQAGGRFSRCKNPSEHSCQYCGRYFCADHAYYVEDHEAVCTRKRCREKRDDLVVHMDYKAEVARRNRAGLCGEEDCELHAPLQCSLCQGFFCSTHLHDKMYPVFDGFARREQPKSVCRRCWDRRKIWA